VSEVALRLLGEYAPSRPVRLLGVRVASLAAARASGEDPGEASGAPEQGAGRVQQLGLPV
jgi:hypothetical protein